MVAPILISGPSQVVFTAQRMPDGWVFNPQVQVRSNNTFGCNAVIFPPTTSNPMAPTGISSIGVEWTGRGKDFTAELSTTFDGRKGDEHVLQYFQGLTNQFALGGKLIARAGPFLSSGVKGVDFGLNASWMSADQTRTVCAKYDPSGDTPLMLRFHREVESSGAQMATEFSVNEEGESITDLSMELPLRHEPQLVQGPYTTLKSSLDSKGVMKVGLEHAIGVGADATGRLEMGCSMDHFRERYQFGVGYNMSN